MGKHKENLVNVGVDEGKVDDMFLKVMTTSKPKVTSEWILVFGCSYHMCPTRD